MQHERSATKLAKQLTNPTKLHRAKSAKSAKSHTSHISHLTTAYTVGMDSHKSQLPTVSDAALTTRQVARLLNVSNMSIYRFIAAGDLPAFKVGAKYRILSSSLSAYVNARQSRWPSVQC